MVGVLNGDVFIHLGIVVIIAAIAAFILRLVKQPQLLAYVLAGILITPVFGLVTDTSVIESMSIIGIAFLLFLVGLEMDLKALKNVSLVAGLGGMIQIIILFVFGYIISLLLGFLSLEAAYVGLVLAFSSTMVVMKLLSDKRELNTLHGRIAIGTLLVQDIVAIFALLILTSLNDFTLAFFGLVLLKFSLFVGAAYLTSRFVFPRVFRYAARKQELLLISALAVCFIFSLAFHYLGFSIAIGAFIAGVTLGNLEYNIEIIGKVKSLRDFFALLFFVSLGMGLSLEVLDRIWIAFILLLITIIILKPLIIMTICSLFRYTKRPSFLTANSLAQIGEFSLILASQGLLLGHISQDLFSLIVMLMLISIMLTSYYIQYNQWFYRIMSPMLKVFDRFTTEGLEYLPSSVKPKIILCGHNRIGYSVLRNLQKLKKKILVVDYNPEVIFRMVKEGYHCIYGEVTDEEIIERMNLKGITMLISTVPMLEDNLFLLRKAREANKRAKVLVTANTIEEAFELYDKGADYVILPHFLGGEHASNLIDQFRSKKIKLHEEKKKHLEVLKDRKNLGHEHPKHN